MHHRCRSSFESMDEQLTIHIKATGQYRALLYNCTSYCTERSRNEYVYPTILYSWLLYSTVRALILLLL